MYHSLVLDRESQEELDAKLREARPGDVITLPNPPLAINMEFSVETENCALSTRKFLRKQATAVKKYTTKKHKHEVFVLPIWQYTCKRDSSETTVRGGVGYLPSKVTLQKVFPVEPAFAITVHKSEGRTMNKVIIALSSSHAKGCDFSYAQVHVAFSRVRQGDHIRLLLTGDDSVRQWESILYLGRLIPKPSIRYYFDGFRRILNYDTPNEGWMENEWNRERANNAYRAEQIDQG